MTFRRPTETAIWTIFAILLLVTGVTGGYTDVFVPRRPQERQEALRNGMKLGGILPFTGEVGPIATTTLIAQGQLFNFVISILTFAAVYFFMKIAERGKKIPSLREPAALSALPELVGRAVETARPIHFTQGFTGLRYTFATATNMAGFSILGRIAELTAQMGAKVYATVCAPDSYLVAAETIHNAYIRAGAFEKQPDVRFLSDNQMAYVSGCNSMMKDEKISANVMVGYFGAETLLLGEGAVAAGAIGFGGTDVYPQIPFLLVTCDYVLIGPEVFSAGAILSKDKVLQGALVGQDVPSYVCLGLLILGAILATFGSRILESILRY
jgi:hypothetical protein